MAIVVRMMSAQLSLLAHTACIPLYSITINPRITSFAAAAASKFP
jgi:hypothetical protein